jgi:predicted aspartyl protease
MGQNYDHLPLRRFRSSLLATTLASGLLASCADQVLYRVPTYSYAPQERESVVQAMAQCHMTTTTANEFQTCMTTRGFGLPTAQPPQQTLPPSRSDKCMIAAGLNPDGTGSYVVSLYNECLAGKRSSGYAASPPPADVVHVSLGRDSSNGYTLPVIIGGINGVAATETFTLDTGASAVTIPVDLAEQLVDDGVFDLGGLHYVSSTLANGNSEPVLVGTLTSLTVGGVTVHHIRCIIGPPGTSLLLGQSFLQKFPAWAIDNIHNILVLRQEVRHEPASGWTAVASGTAPVAPSPAAPVGIAGLTFNQAHDVCGEELQHDGTSASPDAWKSCMQKYGFRLD